MSTHAIQELVAKLTDLEREEAELSEQRKVLHQRMAIFPSEAHHQNERELSEKRNALHHAIDVTRIELATARLAVRDRDSVTS
jgi:hypothetical protein